MEKQTSNVKSVKMLMLPESSVDSKKSSLLPQVQAYNRLTPDKLTLTPGWSMPTPGNKHLRHQLPLSSDAKMIYLAPTDCMCDTSSMTSSAMDSKYTTHRKPTWELLLLLSITSKIPQ
jgi:hypothetical protein